MRDLELPIGTAFDPVPEPMAYLTRKPPPGGLAGADRLRRRPAPGERAGLDGVDLALSGGHSASARPRGGAAPAPQPPAGPIVPKAAGPCLRPDVGRRGAGPAHHPLSRGGGPAEPVPGRNLELAALPEGKLPYDFAPHPVDLNGLCRKAARQLEMPVEAAGCSLVFTDWKESLCTQCDDDLVLILIYHLVSNALRAAGKGGHLELRLERRGRRAFISLLDGAATPWPRPGRAWDWGSPSAATSPGSTRGRCCWPTERSGAFAPPSPSLSAGPAPPRRSILPAASIPPTACPWCCGS